MNSKRFDEEKFPTGGGVLQADAIAMKFINFEVNVPPKRYDSIVPNNDQNYCLTRHNLLLYIEIAVHNDFIQLEVNGHAAEYSRKHLQNR